MKKILTVALLIAMLVHVLPFDAVATVGKVLSEDELARAYALTGLGTGGLSANGDGAYHGGMKPNASWNASQLRDWLDERLDEDLNTIADLLSQAAFTLAELKETNPEEYERLTKGDEDENAQKVYLEAEALRETLRYYEDQLTEDSGVIAEYGRRMNEEGDDLFDSDKVRWSAFIEEAEAEIVEIRQIIAENSGAWEAQIDSLSLFIEYGKSQIGGDAPYWDWMNDLLTEDDAPVTNTAPVARVSASASRVNRLSSAAGVAGNAVDAKITVLSENQVAISLQTGTAQGFVPLKGVDIQVRDALKSDGELRKFTTNENGAAVIPVNMFKMDRYENVHLYVVADLRQQGYRDVVIEDLDLAKGENYTVNMVPLGGPSANGETANAADDPYVYMMSFNHKDIMNEKYDMIYSTVNDYEFEIKVAVRNPSGKSLPDLLMRYYGSDSALSPGRYYYAEPTGHEGEVYTFKGPWKQKIAPNPNEGGKDRTPVTFMFGKDAPESLVFPSKLVSHKSAVDKPIDYGTGVPSVFQNVLGKGFSMGFKIPKIDFNVGLNLPFQKYLPRIVIDPAGFVNIFIGSTVFDDESKKALQFWQSNDLKAYRQAETFLEKEGAFACIGGKFKLANGFYKAKGFKFMGESKIDVGMFALASGRWELDEAVEDVKTTEVDLKVGLGVSLNYSYSFTVPFSLGVVPFYVAFTFGVSVGFGVNLALRFCWVNGGFRNWKLSPVEEITITIGLLLAVSLGMGFKGLLEIWVELSATLNLMLRLNITDAAPLSATVAGEVKLSAGATIVLLTIRREFPLVGGQLFPEPNANLLDYYMNENADAAREEQVTPGEPMSYPQLTKEAKQAVYGTSSANADSAYKVVEVQGKRFAFHLEYMIGKDNKQHKRVYWQTLNEDITAGIVNGSTQDALDSAELRNSEAGRWITMALADMDEYSFDVATDRNYVFLTVTAARKFDTETGYPERNNLFDFSPDYRYNQNMVAYILVLESDGSGRLNYLLSTRDHLKGRNYFFDACSVSGEMTNYFAVSYDSFINPRIEYAQAVSRSSHVFALDHFEIYGQMPTISYNKDYDMLGATCFAYQGDGLYFLTDRVVNSGMGDNYEYTKVLNTTVRLKEKLNWSLIEKYYATSFVALSQPKNGAAGEKAIEYFDYEMNKVAGVITRNKAIVLDSGDIDNLVLVQPAKKLFDMSGTERRIFYTKKEKNQAGAEQTRLYGMVIAPIRKKNADEMEIDVTKYVYDVVMPTNHFNTCILNNMTYLYWISSAPKQKESDPTIWRVWTMSFDAASNSMTEPAVFAEFKLPPVLYNGSNGGWYRLPVALSNAILTSSGTGFLNAMVTDLEPIPERARPKIAPIMLYHFEEKIQPSANLITAIPRALTVKAGDFEDVTLGLMNDGNVPITTFDIGLYEVVDGKESAQPIETVHFNAIDPAKSRIILTGGKTERTGKQVAYRQEDYGNASRKRDWVLDSEARTYKLAWYNRSYVYDGTRVIAPSSPRHVKSELLMPGSMGSYCASFKIPENWEGKKTLRLKVTAASVESNAMAAVANAAGLISNAENPSATLEYVLNEATGRLELQMPAQPNGALANAIASGLYANAVEITTTDMMLDVQDIDVSHRIYDDPNGTQLLDITLRNFTANGERLKLTCAVYADGSDEAEYLSLPLYESATSSRRTQTITLPVNALVEDPSKHRYARVVVSVVDTEENAYANNEFDVLFDGVDPLRFVTQPEDVTVQAGEDVVFTVEVGGGVQPYSYQWQIWDPVHGKWVDLKGFTDPVLRREDIEKKWNGCRFRCVVTDAEGTQIISQEVTLTVRDGVDTGDRSNLPLYLAVALAALALLWWLRRRREG